MIYHGKELVEVTEPQIFNPPKEMLVWDDCDEGEILNGKYEPQRVMVYGIIATTGANVAALLNGDMVYFEKCAEIPEEPKPRMATNLEFSRWLSQGNGQVHTDTDCGNIDTAIMYGDKGDDTPVRDGLMARKWGDKEWHEPTIDYLGIKEG